jgi:hypothetical protein
MLKRIKNKLYPQCKTIIWYIRFDLLRKQYKLHCKYRYVQVSLPYFTWRYILVSNLNFMITLKYDFSINFHPFSLILSLFYFHWFTLSFHGFIFTDLLLFLISPTPFTYRLPLGFLHLIIGHSLINIQDSAHS